MHDASGSFKSLERETGIEPATNSLEGCDSTTELLPPVSSRWKLKILELMMGLEPMTSPLPRECSTTELHQPSKKPTLQSYREPSRPSMTRKAKNPKRIHASERNLPGSIVCQTRIANTPNTASAITIRPLPAGLRSTNSPLKTHSSKLSGAQGRIRTSVRH